MIERQILAEKVREREIENFVLDHLGRLSCSHVQLQRTPLGEKITVFTSRPGMVVGRKGENIREITTILKEKYGMENPQVEVSEIEAPELDAATIAKSVVNQIESYGPKRFKPIVHKAIESSMRHGAKGIEIVVGGRGVPSERAKSWRFSAGYMKKSGFISESFVDRHHEGCNLKSGTVGVKVSVLRPEVKLPDDLNLELVEQDMKVKAEMIETPKEEHKVEEKKIRKPRKKKEEKTEEIKTENAEVKNEA